MEQYIQKSVLLTEIDERIKVLQKNPHENHKTICHLDSLKQNLNTLEVKEVDYERELSKYVAKGIHRFFSNEGDDYCNMDSVVWQDYVIETAKHFFELGMTVNKEQKGE